jgi:hypothetical protein
MSGDHGGRDLTVTDPSAHTKAETAPLADLRHSTVPGARTGTTIDGGRHGPPPPTLRSCATFGPSSP